MYVLYLFVRMSARLSSFTAVCRSIHPSSISLCVCLSVCLFSVYQFVPLSVTIEKIKTKYSNLFSIFFLPYAAGPILEMHRPPKTNVMWKKSFLVSFYLTLIHLILWARTLMIHIFKIWDEFKSGNIRVLLCQTRDNLLITSRYAFR